MKTSILILLALALWQPADAARRGRRLPAGEPEILRRQQPERERVEPWGAISASTAAAGAVAIRWTATNTRAAQVTVREGSGPERLFACARSGRETVEWVRPGASYEFRLYIALSCQESRRVGAPLASVTVSGPVPETPRLGYRVGVNYHSVSADFGDEDADGDGLRGGLFIRSYHKPQVRAEVQRQLRAMAASGAGIIKTPLWLVDPYGDENRSDYAWRLSFPPSKGELHNLRDYARDVVALRTPDGRPLELQLSLGWLGCADYQREETKGLYGWCDLPWDALIARAKESVSDILAFAEDASVVYLEGEVMIGAKANEDRFLRELYPYFLEQAERRGIRGALYFLIAGNEEEIFDEGFRDAEFPALDGRRSLYWLHRSVEFLKREGLPVPDRLDFSFYPNPRSRPVAQLVERVFDDLDALYPGVPLGVSETYYFADLARRRALGRAFADANARRSAPAFTLFWTTPNSGGEGVHAGFPFDFAAFLP